MYFLKFRSNFIEKKTLNDASNSLPDSDLNLPEMKTKSPSCPSGGVHMYVLSHWHLFEVEAHVAFTFLALQIRPHRLPKSVYPKNWQVGLGDLV